MSTDIIFMSLQSGWTVPLKGTWIQTSHKKWTRQEKGEIDKKVNIYI